MTSNTSSRKPKPVLPGSGPAGRVEQMLRVDHAGETAAVQIYKGQQAIFKHVRNKQSLAGEFARMQAEEQVHLDAFEAQMRERGHRPTAAIGLWQGMSYALGVGTALLGEKAAHACTESVESVIEEHYAGQIDELKRSKSEPELQEMFEKFRNDELDHRDRAIESGAEQAPGYTLLSAVIRLGCKAAIRISEKI